MKENNFRSYVIINFNLLYIYIILLKTLKSNFIYLQTFIFSQVTSYNYNQVNIVEIRHVDSLRHLTGLLKYNVFF